MTANDIDVLIHYYTSPAPHARIGSPVVKSAIYRFVKDGIFKKTDDDDVYDVTEKGGAFVT